MKEELLQGLLDVAGTFANDVLVKEQRKQLMPTWVILTGKGKCVVMPTPFNNPREKQLAVLFIRMHLETLEAVAYSVVLEAWTRQATKEEIQSDNYVPAGDHPDRREIVLAFASAAGGKRLWRSWNIRRDHLERIIALDLNDLDFEGAQMHSWLLNLLDKPL